MASTSVSSIQHSFKYDVFLSFRGEDTRKSFVDHLYHALKQRSIDTYRDDEKIKKGDRIGEQLLRSIEESKFYIIVFSKNYASSTWCLDELVKIIECQKTKGRIAYPVFYDVEPTEVRKQSGAVGKAFTNHIKDESAGKWQEALREAANLAGWELKNTLDGHEAMFIQKIVKEISLELHVTNLSGDGKLVGMKERVKDVLSSLEMDIDDFRMLGIRGMGGAGKTTLVKTLFDHISIFYEGSSFVENVREISKSIGGLKSLQEKILSDVSKDSHVPVYGVSDLKGMLKKTMCARKVLVILDDVDCIDQLEALVGDPNWFKRGSRVIITTRDKQVLVAHGVSENLILDVNLLSHKEANCLFNRYAFGSDIPTDGFEELSVEFVRYAAGLPLSIKVLGSLLRGRDECEWEDELRRLKSIPLLTTMKILELSYESLEEERKEIFLDVVCMLKGWEKEKAIVVLESRGFHAISGLKDLEQKSLITSDWGRLSMHDHIEEMGRYIVRRLHPDEPWKHSRLWIEEEVEDLLVEDKGTEVTRCITVRVVDPVIVIKGLQKMKQLRFLSVEWKKSSAMSHRDYDYPYDDIGEDSLYLPDGLQYLRWDGYPCTCLPTKFQANNLVGLEICDSKFNQLWEGRERKYLKKLRFIDLYMCKLRSLDIGLFPNLERLRIRLCRLEECHMPFKGSRLKFLSVDCDRVNTLDLSCAQYLETLDIQSRWGLVDFHMPVKSFRLKILTLSISNLNTLDLSWAQKLEHLKLECSNLNKLNLKPILNLKDLKLNFCGKLEELYLPDENVLLESIMLNRSSNIRALDLAGAHNLVNLTVEGCKNLIEIHMPVENVKLKSFKLWDTKLRTLDLSGAHSLVDLNVKSCNNLIELHMPVKNVKLESLDLWDAKVRTLDLAGALNLVEFTVIGCKNLVEYHMPVEIVKLKSFVLRECNIRALDFAGAHNLVHLNVEGCKNLLELHMPAQNVKVGSLELWGAKLRTLDLSGAHELVSLSVQWCRNLFELHMPGEIVKLQSLKLCHSNVRTLDLMGAQNLKSLSIEWCMNLVELHMPIENAKLKSLQLCHSKVRTLDFTRAQNLVSLTGLNCENLVEFGTPVENVRLECLQHLESLSLECSSLVEIHVPIRCLKDHVDIKTSGCHRLNPFLVNQGSPMLLVELRLTVSSSKTTCELHPENNLQCFLFTFIYKEPPSSLTGNFEKHISVHLCTCTDLASLLEGRCELQFLRKLTLEGSIPEVPIELYQLKYLEELKLVSTEKIKHLPDSVCMLKNLKSLRIESCMLLERLPKDLGRLVCLEELKLVSTKRIEHLPDSICMLKNLKSLILESCMLLKRLPEDLGRLECLEELKLESQSIKHLPDNICMLKNLKSLKLESCRLLKRLPKDLGRLVCLEELKLTTDKIEHLPDSICMLKNLKSLKLVFGPLLKRLPEDLGRLERLEELILVSDSIEHLPNSICMLKNLKSLELESCPLLKRLPKDLGRLVCLEELTLESTDKIEHLPDSICMLKNLKSLVLGSCPLLKRLPEDLGRLEYLEKLSLCHCKTLQDIPDSICEMKRLKSFNLRGSILVVKLPEEIGRLECLKELDIIRTGITGLSRSIYQLRGLRIFAARGKLKLFGIRSHRGNYFDTFRI